MSVESRMISCGSSCFSVVVSRFSTDKKGNESVDRPSGVRRRRRTRQNDKQWDIVTKFISDCSQSSEKVCLCDSV
jgi:hypothetical protein